MFPARNDNGIDIESTSIPLSFSAGFERARSAARRSAYHDITFADDLLSPIVRSPFDDLITFMINVFRACIEATAVVQTATSRDYSLEAKIKINKTIKNYKLRCDTFNYDLRSYLRNYN